MVCLEPLSVLLALSQGFRQISVLFPNNLSRSHYQFLEMPGQGTPIEQALHIYLGKCEKATEFQAAYN